MSNQDVNAVLRSQEYFRLKQVVQSPGDIYELDESAKAVYIGPDSDIAEVEMTYFNPDEPLSLETATVAVNGPFVGRVDTLLNTQVPSTGQPARILLSPVDIVDNNYANPVSDAFRSFTVPAIIDVIVALKPLSSIPSVRADRTFRFPSVPFARDNVPAGPPGNNGSTDLIIPIYGRRMVTVQVAGNSVNVRMGLVTLLPGVPTAPRDLGSFTIPTVLLPIKFLRAGVYRANDAARQGTIYDNTGLQTAEYAESDMPDDAVFNPTGAFPSPRGMADLLILNISSPGVMPGVTSFADVFIKVTDRES